ncbi:hypothetical protein T484DRAFT_1813460 [Baffinella frigidus]|nr:hypothetical protein T484DRAFT_1813460 [Cryptophyta sp. CCMP2293]
MIATRGPSSWQHPLQDHSRALGMMIFMNNLLPVTIGNTIAGAFLVAMSYAIVFGTPGKKINAFFEGK